MSDTIIQVENLSKKYLIKHQQTSSSVTLSEKITNSLRLFGHRSNKSLDEISNSLNQEEFWALKDVSFEVKLGDHLGIIGRNGAGKSTLLKILSRITSPTSGQVTIRGRIASLLEVGTGFHADLTGRENIFLNGSIVGMKKAEIERKFDEIVSFSGVEKFLDTPVKRYSSGMYMRLAFAVAAHLDTEILIIDEVLAVGDTAFQKKCLKKIQESTGQGRTILFVSHNLSILQGLCERGIFLQDRTVRKDGPIEDVIQDYVQMLEESESQNLLERNDRVGLGVTRLSQAKIISHDNVETTTLITGMPAVFVFQVTRHLPQLSCSFSIRNHLGQVLTYCNSTVRSSEDRYERDMEKTLTCCFDELLLGPGRYQIDVSIVGDHELQDHLTAAIVFDVEPGTIRDRRVLTYPTILGTIAHPHRWIVPQE